MSRAAVDFWFYCTLFGGLPLGILVIMVWGRRVFPRLMKTVNGRKVLDISAVSMQTLIYMFPGLILFILCCIPALYFGNLRKQRQYCLRVIAVNKGITKESRMLAERCGCFDLDELFAENAAAAE